jgi:hypothetical protein
MSNKPRGDDRLVAGDVIAAALLTGATLFSFAAAGHSWLASALASNITAVGALIAPLMLPDNANGRGVVARLHRQIGLLGTLFCLVLLVTSADVRMDWLRLDLQVHVWLPWLIHPVVFAAIGGAAHHRLRRGPAEPVTPGDTAWFFGLTVTGLVTPWFLAGLLDTIAAHLMVLWP